MSAKPLLRLSKNNSMICKDKPEIWPIWWLKTNLCLTISPNAPEKATIWREDLINFWSSLPISKIATKRTKRMKPIWLLWDSLWPEVNNKEMNSNCKSPKFPLWTPNCNLVKPKPTNWETPTPISPNSSKNSTTFKTKLETEIPWFLKSPTWETNLPPN